MLAASGSPTARRGVSRKLALQEFSVGVVGVLGGATLFAPPAEALTQEEQLALYLESKKKRELKQAYTRANSYGGADLGAISDEAREGANLAGGLPDEDLAAKLAEKAGTKEMKSLAREAPGAAKPKDIEGKDRIRDETKSLKELAREGAPVQKFDGGQAPIQEIPSDAERKEMAQKKLREIIADRDQRS